MPKHSKVRVTDSQRSRRRPLAATAAAIGGAGLVLGAPAAALVAAPAAQAAPVASVPQQLPDLGGLFGGLDLFGGSGLGGLTSLFPSTFLDFAGFIPGLNIFIGNGADGLLPGADGGDAGLFIGNGGNGADGIFNPLTGTSNDGGNGGNAGIFFGDGGNGGDGVNGRPAEYLLGAQILPAAEATDGGNGGSGAFFIGNGGAGGNGGEGRDGVNPTADLPGLPGQNALTAVGNGGDGLIILRG